MFFNTLFGALYAGNKCFLVYYILLERAAGKCVLCITGGSQLFFMYSNLVNDELKTSIYNSRVSWHTCDVFERVESQSNKGLFLFTFIYTYTHVKSLWIHFNITFNINSFFKERIQFSYDLACFCNSSLEEFGYFRVCANV